VVARVAVRPADLARLAAGGVAGVYALGALAAARGPGERTTYAGESELAAALVVVAGLALVAAGVVTSLARRSGRIGDLALLAGYLWFAPLWAGWRGGPPLVLSLGTLVAGFTFAVLVHVVVAFPTGVLRSMEARALVVAVYSEAGLSALGRALFRDPFFDPTCWENCTDNVFLVRSLPHLARAIQHVDVWFAVAAATALAAVCVLRLAAASAPARRTLGPVLAGGIALAGATIAHSVALTRSAAEDPSDGAFQAIFLVGCAAVMIIALGLPWALVQARIQRRSVTRIVADLGDAPSPGLLQSALANAIGDPELRIAYWLPDAQRYVDGHGEPVPKPVPGSGRAITGLVRGGRQVAVVIHTAAVADLERELGAAVRLALENERLQAEVLAQLEDLRVSRTRIVETGDSERRRLERDLHDGAQQRLLALSYDLRLARAGAAADGDAELARMLDAAGDETLAALDELRELAQGIYPAILTEAGIAPALEALADEAPLPVELDEVVSERQPPAVETTAYVTVAEAIDDAARRGAPFLSVRVRSAEGCLSITAEDEGRPRTRGLPHLADRVGALGGTLELGDRILRAEIRCE
jgi:signal transduction histidine kinase